MYLDPGFGGMLIQVVVALAAVGGGIVFAMRRKIKALFSKGTGNNVETTVAEHPTDASADDAIDMLSDD